MVPLLETDMALNVKSLLLKSVALTIDHSEKIISLLSLFVFKVRALPWIIFLFRIYLIDLETSVVLF